MNAEEARGILAKLPWSNAFDAPTLRRANEYLRQGHLESLVFEPVGKSNGRLLARVRGSQDNHYEATIEIHQEKGGPKLSGHCECPVGMFCKHQVVLLLYAQIHDVDRWPKDQAEERVSAGAPEPVKDPLQALPEWMRDTASEVLGINQSNTLETWDHWLQQHDLVEIADEEEPESTENRRFGIILREENDELLTAQLAFFRPGRGKMGGWVDPKPLMLTEKGTSPSLEGGWTEEEILALGALLANYGYYSKANQPIMIDAVHLESALQVLMKRHPVYWQRGSMPIEQSSPLSLQLQWEDLENGNQRLVPQVIVDNGGPPLILKGHGLWYVQPKAGRFGQILGETRWLRWINRSPELLPEDVEAVTRRLREKIGTSLAMPKTRTVRVVSPRAIPVLVLNKVWIPDSYSSTGYWAGAATLYFEYEGQRLSPVRGKARQRVLKGAEVLEVVRELETEQAAERQMEALFLCDAVSWSYSRFFNRSGFTPNQYLLCPDRRRPAPAEDWAETLKALLQAGFLLEYAADFPRDDVVEIDAWHAELEESGNAWFDVSLGIDVEGQRVDLLPILRRILVDPDFPLRQPKNEVPGATWLVRLDEHRSIRLPMARLRAMLEPLLEWLLSNDDGLQLHRTQAERLQRVAEEAQLTWRGGEALRNRIRQLQAKTTTPRTPKGFLATLRPYQRDGLAWLNFLSDAGLGGVLADDMGLGKTVQVLAHLVSEKNRKRLSQPALVVAPTSLVGNWRDEAARFAPDLNVLVLHGADRADRYDEIASADLVITTYPLLPRDRDSLCEQQFSLLIMDEAQAIKNARSQAAQVVRDIPTQRRLAMTGTPLENHLGELWAQFDAVEPGLLGSETSFVRTYRTPIEKQGDEDRKHRLSRRIGSLLLRRRKEDVLDDLPPKTEIVHSLELEGGQRQLYETLRLAQHARVKDSIAQRGLGQSGIVVIDALLKLRQACCDPRLVKLDSARKVEESAKLDALLDLLQNLRDEGRHILVFSQFTQMLALISEALDKQGIEHLSLTGDTPSSTRTDLVRRFQSGDVPVFLISLKAGGVGLNLTTADTVIHYDPWWNPAVEAQATDRAHRIGQDKPVFVYKLICAGTVEEKIQAMQNRKAELARAVLEGGASTSLRFDESDLTELFGPI